jgi:tRNA A37 N6-isopentenylltransferase MiaA
LSSLSFWHSQKYKFISIQHEHNLGITGLFQAIGWDALLPYVTLPWAEQVSPYGSQILGECIDKFANRDMEYSKKQNHWLKERIYKPSQHKKISLKKLRHISRTIRVLSNCAS